MRSILIWSSRARTEMEGRDVAARGSLISRLVKVSRLWDTDLRDLATGW